jgi:uncharacterized membrane protein YkoI
MRDKLKGALFVAAAIAALAVGGAAIAGATGGGDDGNGKPVTGSALDQASKAALEQTGGGRVSGSEVNDEEGAYEIEVTRDDGSKVDVHLDRGFNVINAQGDGEGSGENEGSDTD